MLNQILNVQIFFSLFFYSDKIFDEVFTYLFIYLFVLLKTWDILESEHSCRNITDHLPSPSVYLLHT